jgi:TolB-like protein/predicted Zn-dependent protease
VKSDNFFAELKRRNVYNVAVAYGGVGWLVVQIAATTVPLLHLPDWIPPAVVVMTIIGFPVALILAWAFDLTSEGVRREDTYAVSPQRSHNRAWIYVALLAGVLAAALFFLGRYTARSTIDAADVPLKSIAVLPFENLSEDKANSFFADGVQDEILTDLSKVADLKVISRTSVMQYKNVVTRNLREIGQQLRVAHVLVGSVQRTSNRIRVTAQLLDARTDAHIWAEHYDRDLADVFAIQSEIAQHIADQLRAKISPGEKTAIAKKPTQDLEAYDLYLQAKELVHNVDPQADASSDERSTQAGALLEKAVARDPAFSLAYCLLTEVNLARYWTDERQAIYRARAETALQKAIQLAPDAGETHLAQAHFYYYGNRDYDHALEELEMAARLLPNSSEVLILSGLIERRLGRWTDAVRHIAKAVELNPREMGPRVTACSTYVMVRRYAEAIQVADRAIADFPAAASTFQLRKGEAALQAGDLKTARASVNATAADKRKTPELFLLWYGIAMCERNYEDARNAIASRVHLANREDLAPDPLFEGEVARAEGNSEKARAAFLDARKGCETLIANHPRDGLYLSQAAIVDAALGRKEEALREIQKALELEKDPLQRVVILLHEAMVYSRLGDREQAFRQLEELSKIPLGIDYGSLRFDPEWDTLRGDPGFETIVASLLPQPANSSPARR